MRGKELKMKLAQLHKEISKASLRVSADLTNDFKSIILETDQRKISPFTRLLWEEQQKHLQSSQNNATYHPMKPDTDVTYQTVNFFCFDKCFVYFIPDVFHIIFEEISSRPPIQYKVSILDLYGATICAYFGIAFLLCFTEIENAVYKSCQNSMLLFINGLIFDIMNIRNNQSLEFE